METIPTPVVPDEVYICIIKKNCKIFLSFLYFTCIYSIFLGSRIPSGTQILSNGTSLHASVIRRISDDDVISTELQQLFSNNPHCSTILHNRTNSSKIWGKPSSTSLENV